MKADFKVRIKKKITTAYIAKIAVLSAVAFVLYMYGKFNLPFMFPSFLEIQFSELPALLAGFALDPVAGAIVVIVKCLLKFPFSSTGFVGEIMDIVIGLSYVLPASIIYAKIKTRKGAVMGLVIGTCIATVLSMLFNRFIAIPFYVKMLFSDNFDAIVGMLKPLYASINRDNFYNFYIFVGVLPFNMLRLGLVSLVTFFVYKRLSKMLHWEKTVKIEISTEKDLDKIAENFCKKDETNLCEKQSQNDKSDCIIEPEEL